MLELLFIFYLLFKNIFFFIGLFTSLIFIYWIFYVGVAGNPYRVFCSSWWLYIITPWSYINEIKHYYQRLRYGISYSDAWSFDHHILGILPIGIKHVKDSGLAPDLPEKDWTDMLDGMENYLHIYDCYDIKCPISHKQLTKDFRYSMQLFTKHFSRLWI